MTHPLASTFFVSDLRGAPSCNLSSPVLTLKFLTLQHWINLLCFSKEELFLKVNHVLRLWNFMNFYPLTLKFSWNIHERFHNFIWSNVFGGFATRYCWVSLVFLINMKIQESPPVKNYDIYWEQIVFFIAVLLFLNVKK